MTASRREEWGRMMNAQFVELMKQRVGNPWDKDNMMHSEGYHRDLSDEMRAEIEEELTYLTDRLRTRQESLAIAREAMINAFDEAAASVE